MTATYAPTGASIGIVAPGTSGTKTVTVGANTATITTPTATPASTVWGQSTTLAVTVTGVQPQTPLQYPER